VFYGGANVTTEFATEDMNPEYNGLLGIQKLSPALQPRCLIALINRSTSDRNIPHTKSNIKDAMLHQLDIQFPGLMGCETIAIPDDFSINSTLPALLQYDSIFMHEYMFQGVSDVWPQDITPYTAASSDKFFVDVLSTLLSFGPVHLNLITLNVENITQTPMIIVDLDKIPNLTTPLHVAFTLYWAKMLDLEERKEEDATWVTASTTELQGACQRMSATDAVPVTNLKKFTFASAAVAYNKGWINGQKARDLIRNAAAERANLRRLAPHNASSVMRSIRERNSV
jgi:hypothetical protein